MYHKIVILFYRDKTSLTFCSFHILRSKFNQIFNQSSIHFEILLTDGELLVCSVVSDLLQN